jgi:hypothetical protein
MASIRGVVQPVGKEMELHNAELGSPRRDNGLFSDSPFKASAFRPF